jgi:hypothetical protein
MVDILNTQQLKNSFGKLKADAIPVFGKMSPQHVVEHLAKVLKASTGQVQIKLHLTLEEAEILKKKIIYSDFQFSPGIKSPIMGDEPPPLLHKNLDDALTELYQETKHFENYYNTNPEATHTHPRMGELQFSEWLIFHNKHFTHHFKQFNL